MILSPNVFICIANVNAIVICCIFCFSCVGGTDNMKHHNEVELFESIDPNVSTPPDGLCSNSGYKSSICMAHVLLCVTQNSVILLQESKHKRTDRSVFCCLKKTEPGKSWPRLTKEKTKVSV